MGRRIACGTLAPFRDAHSMLLEAADPTTRPYGPWNPGIVSELPARLLPLSTIFRSEHVVTTVAQAQALQELTGLPLEDLVVFRPERLVLHELLIRVTADLSVPDGSKVEDLGINFRRMTEAIQKRYLEAQMSAIVAEYDALRQTLSGLIHRELASAAADAYDTPSNERAAPTRGILKALFSLRQRREPPPRVEDEWEREERMLRTWSAKAQANDSLQRAAYRALIRIVSAVRSRHGRLWGERAMLGEATLGVACNDYGAEMIGRLIEPHVAAAANALGFHRLPAQARPVVMNTKGASASGKSTMRPLQKRLAGEIGVVWTDFALISPDIWRKYLLDYGSLGADFKYAGTLTGKELAIIDQKLDRYMALKAERGAMSHLLIDRFRFDSFAPDSEEAGSNLLTRFGHLVYMFFMITPPHETVERSWRRGLEVGRYKAVDDLLAHNVEAYTGMPRLFFTWALRPNKAVHYEFLDNSVAYGERPRTVAFGWNGEMNVLDVKSMLDIDRYRKIDIGATQPSEVYADPKAMAAENNTTFLVECARLLSRVNFADRDTGRIYARIEGGRLAWSDPEALASALDARDTRAGLLAVAPEVLMHASPASEPAQASPQYLQADRFQTLGRWGDDRPRRADAVASHG
jgi:hypothetical protein